MYLVNNIGDILISLAIQMDHQVICQKSSRLDLQKGWSERIEFEAVPIFVRLDWSVTM